jgi:hypothetical protein
MRLGQGTAGGVIPDKVGHFVHHIEAIVAAPDAWSRRTRSTRTSRDGFPAPALLRAISAGGAGPRLPLKPVSRRKGKPRDGPLSLAPDADQRAEEFITRLRGRGAINEGFWRSVLKRVTPCAVPQAGWWAPAAMLPFLRRGPRHQPPSCPGRGGRPRRDHLGGAAFHPTPKESRDSLGQGAAVCGRKGDLGRKSQLHNSN